MGISTGVDLKLLAETGEWIAHLIGVENASRAGVALQATRHLKPAASQALKKAIGLPPQLPRSSWSIIEDA